MNADQKQTEVILLGTMHLPPSDFPDYARRLSEIIEEIAPDSICSELSPEQLAGTQPCESKPEQRDVVMPTARRLGTPIVPIQPATDVAIEWEERYKAAEKELKATEEGRNFHDLSSSLAMEEARLWGEYMTSADCIENVQINEYHVFPQARDMIEEKWAPQLARVLTEWNEYFLSSIIANVEAGPGRRILVIAGLWHKHWLWNKLVQRDDVCVYNLHTFRLSRIETTR
jgi:hypothetical protein